MITKPIAALLVCTFLLSDVHLVLADISHDTLSPSSRFKPIDNVVRNPDGTPTVTIDEAEEQFWADETARSIDKGETKGEALETAFRKQVAFRFVSTLIGKYLRLGISPETVRSQIEKRFGETGIDEAQESDLFLSQSDLRAITYDPKTNSYLLPIYRDGNHAFDYRYYIDLERDPDPTWTIPLGDGTDVYVKLEVVDAGSAGTGYTPKAQPVPNSSGNVSLSPDTVPEEVGQERSGVTYLQPGNGPIDWRVVFGNDHPVVVEVGHGDARVLKAESERHPELNFVGIDIRRLGDAHSQTLGLGPNVRLIEGDGGSVLEKNFTDGSVADIRFIFPDPGNVSDLHPVLEAYDARLFRPAFFRVIFRKLQQGGRMLVISESKAVDRNVLAEIAKIDGFRGRLQTFLFKHDPFAGISLEASSLYQRMVAGGNAREYYVVTAEKTGTDADAGTLSGNVSPAVPPSGIEAVTFWRPGSPDAGEDVSIADEEVGRAIEAIGSGKWKFTAVVNGDRLSLGIIDEKKKNHHPAIKTPNMTTQPVKGDIVDGQLLLIPWEIEVRTPAEWRSQMVRVARFLIERGADPAMPLHEALRVSGAIPRLFVPDPVPHTLGGLACLPLPDDVARISALVHRLVNRLRSDLSPGQAEFLALVRVLARLGTDSAIDGIRAVAEWKRAPDEQILIISALGETANPRALPILLRLLFSGYIDALDAIVAILKRQEVPLRDAAESLTAQCAGTAYMRVVPWIRWRVQAEEERRHCLGALVAEMRHAPFFERKIICETINKTMDLPFSVVFDENRSAYMVRRDKGFDATVDLLRSTGLGTMHEWRGIDIGTGTGKIPAALEAIAQSVDPQAGIFGNEREFDHVAVPSENRGSFFVGDAEELPVGDRSCAVATLHNCFREKSGRYIGEAARVVRDDGAIFFVTYHAWHTFRGQFVRQLIENGFDLVEMPLPDDYPRSAEWVDDGLLLVARKPAAGVPVLAKRVDGIESLFADLIVDHDQGRPLSLPGDGIAGLPYPEDLPTLDQAARDRALQWGLPAMSIHDAIDAVIRRDEKEGLRHAVDRIPTDLLEGLLTSASGAFAGVYETERIVRHAILSMPKVATAEEYDAIDWDRYYEEVARDISANGFTWGKLDDMGYGERGLWTFQGTAPIEDDYPNPVFEIRFKGRVVEESAIIKELVPLVDECLSGYEAMTGENLDDAIRGWVANLLAEALLYAFSIDGIDGISNFNYFVIKNRDIVQNPGAIRLVSPKSLVQRLNAEVTGGVRDRAASTDERLVNVRVVDPRILVDMRYATPNNFMGKAVYPPDAPCLLREGVARRLSKVQERLAGQGLGLKVLDGYRPLAIQRAMWAWHPDETFVANPARGSNHNRAGAVDVTLVDAAGNELPMPSAYDEFSERAHRKYGGATEEEARNRSILEAAMQAEGFIGYEMEWWHYDDEAAGGYPVLDLSFLEAERGVASSLAGPGNSAPKCVVATLSSIGLCVGLGLPVAVIAIGAAIDFILVPWLFAKFTSKEIAISNVLSYFADMYKKITAPPDRPRKVPRRIPLLANTMLGGGSSSTPGKETPSPERESSPNDALDHSGAATPRAARYDLSFDRHTFSVTIDDALGLSGEMVAALCEEVIAAAGSRSYRFPSGLTIAYSSEPSSALFVVSADARSISVNSAVRRIAHDDVMRGILIQTAVYHGLAALLQASPDATEADRLNETARFMLSWMGEYRVGLDEIARELAAIGIDGEPFAGVVRSVAAEDTAAPIDPDVADKLAPAVTGLSDVIAARAREDDGCVISLDGPSGAGKTTVIKLIEARLQEMGHRVVVLEFDELLKNRKWRQAVQKRLLGEPIGPEEEALLGADFMQTIRPGAEYRAESEDFWRNDDAQTIVEEVRAFRQGGSDACTVTIKDAYDQKTKGTIPEKAYPIRKGDIVIITGKYVNRAQHAPFYDLRFRLVDNPKVISKRFEERTRKLSPDDAQRQSRFNTQALLPSWQAYDTATLRSIDLFLHVVTGELSPSSDPRPVVDLDTFLAMNEGFDARPHVTLSPFAEKLGLTDSGYVHSLSYNYFTGLLTRAVLGTDDGREIVVRAIDDYPTEPSFGRLVDMVDTSADTASAAPSVYNLYEMVNGEAVYRGWIDLGVARTISMHATARDDAALRSLVERLLADTAAGTIPYALRPYTLDAVSKGKPVAVAPYDVYGDFYEGIRRGAADIEEIVEEDLVRSRTFLAPDGGLRPPEERRQNGVFGVTEVAFLSSSETRARMAAFQSELRARFGSALYLVDEEKLHFTTQGLELQWDDKAAGTTRELARHQDLNAIDPATEPYAGVGDRARAIRTAALRMQVARVNWNPSIGIFWELRPYLLPGEADPVMERRAAWDLPQPRPPHVTAAYFTRPLSKEEVADLRAIIARYQTPGHFGDIDVDGAQVIAYEDLSFNAGYRVLATVPFRTDAAHPAEAQERSPDVRTSSDGGVYAGMNLFIPHAWIRPDGGIYWYKVAAAARTALSSIPYLIPACAFITYLILDRLGLPTDSAEDFFGAAVACGSLTVQPVGGIDGDRPRGVRVEPVPGARGILPDDGRNEAGAEAKKKDAETGKGEGAFKALLERDPVGDGAALSHPRGTFDPFEGARIEDMESIRARQSADGLLPSASSVIAAYKETQDALAAQEKGRIILNGREVSDEAATTYMQRAADSGSVFNVLFVGNDLHVGGGPFGDFSHHATIQRPSVSDGVTEHYPIRLATTNRLLLIMRTNRGFDRTLSAGVKEEMRNAFIRLAIVFNEKGWFTSSTFDNPTQEYIHYLTGRNVSTVKDLARIGLATTGGSVSPNGVGARPASAGPRFPGDGPGAMHIDQPFDGSDDGAGIERVVRAVAREAARRYDPTVPGNCVDATAYVKAELERRGIASTERTVYIPFDCSKEVVRAQTATTTHVILEVAGAEPLVIDTQLLQFTLPDRNKLSLESGFVGEYIYSADDYYRAVPCYPDSICLGARIGYRPPAQPAPIADIISGDVPPGAERQTIRFADGSSIVVDRDRSTGAVMREEVTHFTIDRNAPGGRRLLERRVYNAGHRFERVVYYNPAGEAVQAETAADFYLFKDGNARWMDMNSFVARPILEEAITGRKGRPLTAGEREELERFIPALFDSDVLTYLNTNTYRNGYPLLCTATARHIDEILHDHGFAAQVIDHGQHTVVVTDIAGVPFVIDGAAGQFEVRMPPLDVRYPMNARDLCRRTGLVIMPLDVAETFLIAPGHYRHAGEVGTSPTGTQDDGNGSVYLSMNPIIPWRWVRRDGGIDWAKARADLRKFFAPLLPAKTDRPAGDFSPHWFSQIRFDEGAYIMRQGDPAKYLYIVKEGTVEVEVAGQKIATVGPGEWLGEIGLFLHIPRTASARVVSAGGAVLYRVSERQFRRHLNGSSGLAARLNRTVVQRIIGAIKSLRRSGHDEVYDYLPGALRSILQAFPAPAGKKVMIVGHASLPCLSVFLAWLGMEVTVVDIDEDLIEIDRTVFESMRILKPDMMPPVYLSGVNLDALTADRLGDFGLAPHRFDLILALDLIGSAWTLSGDPSKFVTNIALLARENGIAFVSSEPLPSADGRSSGPRFYETFSQIIGPDRVALITPEEVAPIITPYSYLNEAGPAPTPNVAIRLRRAAPGSLLASRRQFLQVSSVAVASAAEVLAPGTLRPLVSLLAGDASIADDWVEEEGLRLYEMFGQMQTALEKSILHLFGIEADDWGLVHSIDEAGRPGPVNLMRAGEWFSHTNERLGLWVEYYDRVINRLYRDPVLGRYVTLCGTDSEAFSLLAHVPPDIMGMVERGVAAFTNNGLRTAQILYRLSDEAVQALSGADPAEREALLDDLFAEEGGSSERARDYRERIRRLTDELEGLRARLLELPRERYEDAGQTEWLAGEEVSLVAAIERLERRIAAWRVVAEDLARQAGRSPADLSSGPRFPGDGPGAMHRDQPFDGDPDVLTIGSVIDVVCRADDENGLANAAMVAMAGIEMGFFSQDEYIAVLADLARQDGSMAVRARRVSECIDWAAFMRHLLNVSGDPLVNGRPVGYEDMRELLAGLGAGEISFAMLSTTAGGSFALDLMPGRVLPQRMPLWQTDQQRATTGSIGHRSVAIVPPAAWRDALTSPQTREAILTDQIRLARLFLVYGVAPDLQVTADTHIVLEKLGEEGIDTIGDLARLSVPGEEDRGTTFVSSPAYRAVVAEVADYLTRAQEAKRASGATGRIFVAIDGIDGPDKHTFVHDELVPYLMAAGRRVVIVRGEWTAHDKTRRALNPHDYAIYENWFEYSRLAEWLRELHLPGRRTWEAAALYDNATGRLSGRAGFDVDDETIVIVEGPFLQRPDIARQIDLAVYCDGAPERLRSRRPAALSVTAGMDADEERRLIDEVILPAYARYDASIGPLGRAALVIGDDGAGHLSVIVNREPTFALTASAGAGDAAVSIITPAEIAREIDWINARHGTVIFDEAHKRTFTAKIASMRLVKGRRFLVVGPGGADCLPILLRRLGLAVTTIDIDAGAASRDLAFFGRFGIDDIRVTSSYDELEGTVFDYASVFSVLHQITNPFNNALLHSYVYPANPLLAGDNASVPGGAADLICSFEMRKVMAPIAALINPDGGYLFVNDIASQSLQECLTNADHHLTERGLEYVHRALAMVADEVNAVFEVQPDIDVDHLTMSLAHLGELAYNGRNGVAYRLRPIPGRMVPLPIPGAVAAARPGRGPVSSATLYPFVEAEGGRYRVAARLEPSPPSALEGRVSANGAIDILPGEMVVAELKAGEHLLTDDLYTCSAFIGRGTTADGRILTVLAHIMPLVDDQQAVRRQMEMLMRVIRMQGFVSFQAIVDGSADDRATISAFLGLMGDDLAGCGTAFSYHADASSWNRRRGYLKGSVTVDEREAVITHTVADATISTIIGRWETDAVISALTAHRASGRLADLGRTVTGTNPNLQIGERSFYAYRGGLDDPRAVFNTAITRAANEHGVVLVLDFNSDRREDIGLNATDGIDIMRDLGAYRGTIHTRPDGTRSSIFMLDHHFDARGFADWSTTPLVVRYLQALQARADLPGASADAEAGALLDQIALTGFSVANHQDADMVLAHYLMRHANDRALLSDWGEVFAHAARWQDHPSLVPPRETPEDAALFARAERLKIALEGLTRPAEKSSTPSFEDVLTRYLPAALRYAAGELPDDDDTRFIDEGYRRTLAMTADNHAYLRSTETTYTAYGRVLAVDTGHRKIDAGDVVSFLVTDSPACLDEIDVVIVCNVDDQGRTTVKLRSIFSGAHDLVDLFRVYTYCNGRFMDVIARGREFAGRIDAGVGIFSSLLADTEITEFAREINELIAPPDGEAMSSAGPAAAPAHPFPADEGDAFSATMPDDLFGADDLDDVVIDDLPTPDTEIRADTLPAGTALLVTRNGRRIGYAWFDDAGGGDIRLLDIFVDERYSLGGVGTALMGTLFRRVMRGGGSRLVLTCGKNEAVALRFFNTLAETFGVMMTTTDLPGDPSRCVITYDMRGQTADVEEAIDAAIDDLFEYDLASAFDDASRQGADPVAYMEGLDRAAEGGDSVARELLTNFKRLGGEKTAADAKPLPAEAEKKAVAFADTVKLVPSEAVLKRPLMFALGTGWIKGYAPGTDQHRALNPLITRLNRFCAEHDMPFVAAPDGDLLTAIEEDKAARMAEAARTGKEYVAPEIIVLAGAETVTSDAFLQFRAAAGAFLVGVDNADLDEESYVRLLEMFTMAINLRFAALGTVDPYKNPYIGLTDRNGIPILLPRAGKVRALSYTELKALYDIQKFA